MVHYKTNTQTTAKTATDPSATAIGAVRVHSGGLAWSRRSERGIEDRSKGLTRLRVQLQDREEYVERRSGRREQSKYEGPGQRDWSPESKPGLDGDDICFCFIEYAKAFDCVDHNKLWKILKEMGMPDHLTCLLRNINAGQEAIVRTGHGTTDWFQIGKGVHQGCILSSCLFNLHAEYTMRNVGLEEAQAGIKIAGRNINNLRYADDIALWQKVKN